MIIKRIFPIYLAIDIQKITKNVQFCDHVLDVLQPPVKKLRIHIYTYVIWIEYLFVFHCMSCKYRALCIFIIKYKRSVRISFFFLFYYLEQTHNACRHSRCMRQMECTFIFAFMNTWSTEKYNCMDIYSNLDSFVSIKLTRMSDDIVSILYGDSFFLFKRNVRLSSVVWSCLPWVV